MPGRPQCPSRPARTTPRRCRSRRLARASRSWPSRTRARSRCSWRRRAGRRWQAPRGRCDRPRRGSPDAGARRRPSTIDAEARLSPAASSSLHARERLLEIVWRASPIERSPRTALRPSSMTALIRCQHARQRRLAPASRPARRSAATCSCIEALTNPCRSVSCSSCAMRVRSARRSSNRTFSCRATRSTRRRYSAPAGRRAAPADRDAETMPSARASAATSKRSCRLRPVPQPVAVRCRHAEPVGARAEVGVDGLPLGRRLAPVAIEAVEAVAEQHALGHGQAQAGVGRA